MYTFYVHFESPWKLGPESAAAIKSYFTSIQVKSKIRNEELLTRSTRSTLYCFVDVGYKEAYDDVLQKSGLNTRAQVAVEVAVGYDTCKFILGRANSNRNGGKHGGPPPEAEDPFHFYQSKKRPLPSSSPPAGASDSGGNAEVIPPGCSSSYQPSVGSSGRHNRKKRRFSGPASNDTVDHGKQSNSDLRKRMSPESPPLSDQGVSPTNDKPLKRSVLSEVVPYVPQEAQALVPEAMDHLVVTPASATTSYDPSRDPRSYPSLHTGVAASGGPITVPSPLVPADMQTARLINEAVVSAKTEYDRNKAYFFSSLKVTRICFVGDGKQALAKKIRYMVSLQGERQLYILLLGKDGGNAHCRKNDPNIMERYLYGDRGVILADRSSINQDATALLKRLQTRLEQYKWQRNALREEMIKRGIPTVLFTDLFAKECLIGDVSAL